MVKLQYLLGKTSFLCRVQPWDRAAPGNSDRLQEWRAHRAIDLRWLSAPEIGHQGGGPPCPNDLLRNVWDWVMEWPQ